MSKRLVVYPYKMGNSYSRDIAKIFNSIRVYPNRNYIPKKKDVILNWGCSTFPTWKADNWLNSPDAVGRAVNKLCAFAELKFAGVNIPEFTIDKEKATEWLKDGHIVLARHKTTSFGGRGIQVLFPNKDEICDAPLYVKYKKKKKEFRVYVFNGKVFSVSQKKRKREVESDSLIRTHANGWVFAINNIEEPSSLRDIAIQAVKALKLDFGGVDIIWNEGEDKCYVLEVNTAPGIEGTPFNLLCDELKEYISE